MNPERPAALLLALALALAAAHPATGQEPPVDRPAPGAGSRAPSVEPSVADSPAADSAAVEPVVADFLATDVSAADSSAVDSSAAPSASAECRVYETRHLEGHPPVLDGRLDDPAWALVPWGGGFTQRSPYQGEPPTQPTQFKILYGADAMYLGFRCHDDEPARIERQLARRDWFPGDWVEVNLDSRGDHRTAFSFTTSASGVRGDEYVSEDGNIWDTSWDPVWQAATSVDSAGWSAEIRIPFSQLRFSDTAEEGWGLQVTRRIFRREERSVWQYIPEDAPGWVSSFGELRGIADVREPRRIELLPYAVSSVERAARSPGDPFGTGADEELEIGLDGKLGISGGMVLDFTANPDFGQVEADPSEVNLTAFETFLEERRPFFIEGSETFRSLLAEAVTGGSFTSDRLFYSRRIGRAPQLPPSLADGEFVEMPAATRILGAAKLAGKTAGGLSIGLLDAITAEEEASVRGLASRTEVVEPRTNYFAARLQQELGEGRTLLGGMMTATHRDLAGPAKDALPGSAWAGRLDLERRSAGRQWRIRGRLLASEIRGSRAAIQRAQTAPARFYQRPDAGYVDLDSTRTALSGHAGSLYGGKTSGRWRFETGAAWRSPGFEINDLGYLRAADEVNQSTWAGYQSAGGFSVFHEFSVNANQWASWDFGGRNIQRQFNLNTYQVFRNRWEFSGGITRVLEHRSNSHLRGGPGFLLPGSWEASASLETDPRRTVGLEIGHTRLWSDRSSGRTRTSALELSWRPGTRVQVHVGPEMEVEESDLQFVARREHDGEARHLLAALRQETLAATMRIDACVTPNLTVQYYAQPFLAAGRFGRFQRVADGMAGRYRDRTRAFGPEEARFDPGSGSWSFDEDRDGTADYAVADPNFTWRAFQSNLVLRWEYRPGSTLYAVWSQGREAEGAGGELDFGRDVERLFDTHPHDVFLVKVSRWFSW